jgi:hypothetical protein
LLAEPGKRDDSVKYTNKKKQTTTNKSHGWYTPAELTGGDRRKTSGPRLKSKKGSYSNATTKSNRSNIFKGSGPLLSLGRGIVAESEDNFIKKEEKKIHSISKEIETILIGLKSRDKDET